MDEVETSLIERAVAAAMSPMSRSAVARGRRVQIKSILPVWSLTEVVGDGYPLSDQVSAKGEWHAEIFHDGLPVESAVGVMKEGVPVVQATRVRNDQDGISRALQRLHDAHPDVKSVRLLISHRHGVHAVWGRNRGKDVVVCAHVPKSAAHVLPMGRVLLGAEFLGGLQQVPISEWRKPNWTRRMRQARFSKQSRAWGAFTLGFVTLMVLIAWGVTTEPGTSLHRMFVVSEATLVLAYVVAGFLARSRFDGALVDDLNKISLARFQLVVWSIVILGDYYVASMWNLAHGVALPQISSELLGVIGIVGGVPVVSNVIKDSKKNSLGPQLQAGTGSSGLPTPTPPGAGPSVGSLTMNTSTSAASWSDLYFGEEVANQNVIDVSRLQKLLFTTILVIAYLTMVWKGFAAPRVHVDAGSVAGVGMPALDNGFVWLLVISNGAYLASKATPKTPVSATL